MSTISQIRDRLMEVFSQKQADVLAHVVVEAHDDLCTRSDLNSLTGVVKELAEAQVRTEARVEELAEAQKRTETRVGSLAEAIIDLTVTQKKMLLRLDDHDGRSLEYILVRRLPSYVGVEFRKCRVIDNADLVDLLENKVSEAELKDILRTDIIATAKLKERPVHLVVEVSCTGHSSDVQRAARRAAALTAAGFPAIAMVACKKIASPAAVKARQVGVLLLIGSKLRPEAA